MESGEMKYRKLRDSLKQQIRAKKSCSKSLPINLSSNIAKQPSDDKKKKIQRLKETRDYCFLFVHNAEPEPPTKVTAPANVLSLKSKEVTRNSMSQKSLPLDTKPVYTTKIQNHFHKRVTLTSSNHGNTLLNEEKALSTVNKKNVTLPRLKRTAPSAAVKPDLLSVSKQQVSSKKPVTRQVSSSRKPIIKAAVKHGRSEDDENVEKAFRMLRILLGPRRFAAHDDKDIDDRNMEASFDEIMKEERASTRLARKEDKELLRLIIEDEQRKRAVRLANKKQKVNR